MAENLTFNLDVDSSKAVTSVNSFFEAFDKGAAQAKSKLNTAFNQTLQTEVQVEFKNGKVVAKEIQSIKQESNRLKDIYKAVNGELGRTPNQLKKQKQILVSLRGDVQKFKAGTKEITKDWQTLTEKIKKTETALKQMGDGGNAMGGIGAKFALIQTAANLATTAVMNVIRGIADLVATAGRMETLTLQLEAFTGGVEEAEAAFNDFADIAAKSPFNLEQVANAGKIMMAFGMETDEAVKTTKQLGVVAAATGGDINLMARNMGQIVAQGRAYTRDLTQFAIQGVPIWEELSYVTGESVAALKDMAKNGQITGKEVTAALNSMTQEGTAFYEVAERMQETFAGRLALIETAFQKLAKAAVDTFNEIDAAFGYVASQSMVKFAEGVNWVAENLNGLAKAAFAAGTAMTVIAVATAAQPANMSALLLIMGNVVKAYKAWAATSKLVAVAQAFITALTGPAGLAIVAGAALAAAAAYGALSVAMNEGTEGAKEQTSAVDDAITALDGYTEAEEAAAKAGAEDYKTKKEQFMELTKIAEVLNEQKNKEIEILKEQKAQLIENSKIEQDAIRDRISKIKEALSEEKAANKEVKAQIKERYDDEKQRLNDKLDKVREIYDIEIGNLEKKGPAEQALYEYNKKQLEAKVASGALDEEALLSAKARLERMNKQEKIEVLRAKREVETKAVTAEITKNEENRKKAIDDQWDAFKKRAGALESEQKREEKALQDVTKSTNDRIRAIDTTIKRAGALNTTVRNGVKDIEAQITKVNELAAAWRKAAEAAKAKSAAQNSGGGGSGIPSTSNFAGGPIAAGTTSWVNELGKEAFLSASGKLSMINDRGGKWTAPTDGTVIPAHLTKKLSVPSGGVNLNKGTGSATSSAASGGMNLHKLTGAIMAAARGDTVTNNVTIQSANPTNTASNVMVELAKLKRLRYN